MRNKNIHAFLMVYLCVCGCYGALRTVLPQDAQQETEVIYAVGQQAVSDDASVGLDEENDPEKDNATASIAAESNELRHYHGGGRRKNYQYSDSDTDYSTPVYPPLQSGGTHSEIEEEEDNEASGNKITSGSGSSPTLEEYLKGLHCGGCGRNCLLLNPHCMRGARKESQAEAAYYELYGQSSGNEM